MIKRAVVGFFFAGTIAGWLSTNHQLLKTLKALYIPQSSPSNFDPPALHQWFLQQGVYVPQEDIRTPGANDFAMKNSCHGGNIQIWVPIHLRFPLFGEKVVEWCMTLP